MTLALLLPLFPRLVDAQAFSLTCPDTVVITPANFSCEIPLDYSIVNWESSQPLSDTLFDPAPGSNLLPDTVYTLTITAIVAGADTASCQVTAVVEGYSFYLECRQPLLAFPDVTCTDTLSAVEFLEDGPYPCPDQFIVSILGPTGQNLGSVAQAYMIGSTYTIKVQNSETMQACWSLLIPKPDSLPPPITCPADVTVLCIQDPLPDLTGWPIYTGCFDENEVQVEFADSQLNSYCDGDDIAWEVMRTWTGTDIAGVSTSCVQTIRGRRPRFQDIVFPPHFDDSEQPALSCSATEPPQELADTSITGVPMLADVPLSLNNLPCYYAISFEDSISQNCGNSFQIYRKWTVFDLCEGTDTAHVQVIKIADAEAPAIAVADTLWVSTSAPCPTEFELPPVQLLDECSTFDVFIVVGTDTISGNGGSFSLPSGTDYLPAVYTATDACGHTSSDTTILAIGPALLGPCPADTLLNYGTYLSMFSDSVEAQAYGVLEVFGMPQPIFNCDLPMVQSVEVDADSCGRGTLVRTFVVQSQGNSTSCQQTIELIHVSDFVVEFPRDTLIQCTETGLPFSGEPLINFADIERIYIQTLDEFLETSSGFGDHEIRRRWQVFNACVTGDSIDQEVIEERESTIGAVPDCDLDGDGDCDKYTFRDSWTKTSKPTELDATRAFDPDTDPDPDPFDGYIEYVQRIFIRDKTPPRFPDSLEFDPVVADPITCQGTFVATIPPVDDCFLDTVVAYTWQNGQQIFGLGPHTFSMPGDFIYFKAFDKKGNSTGKGVFVEVLPPPIIPHCKDLTVQVDPSEPIFTLQAINFDDGTIANCGQQYQFYFNPNFTEVVREFACCQTGAHPLKIYIRDLTTGYRDSCQVTLTITGNSCTCNTWVAGVVKMPNGMGVGGAEVSLTGSLGSYQQDTTLANGFYQLTAMPSEDLILQASRQGPALNGVSTFDAVIITKHLLHIDSFDSPYQYIAADVNGSMSVTTADLVAMRRVILGIEQAFPAGSWFVLTADHVFPEPHNPWATPLKTVRTVHNILSPVPNLDFIAIKIGDVNFSADPLNLHGHGLEERTLETPLVFHSSQSIQPDGLSRVDLFPSPGRLLGWQFALSYEPDEWEWLGLEAGSVAARPSLQWNQPERGLLLFSWLAEEARPVEFPTSEPAFSLIFRPLKAASAEAPIVQLHTEVLFPEAVFDGELSADVQIQQVPAPLPSDSFLALPPYPNPFTGNTHINLFMPEAGEVRLEVYSVEGQSLLSKHFGLQNGRHLLSIDADELPAAGAYLYALHTAWGTTRGWLLKL